MARIGGFTKTRNYKRRRAVGRHYSPYQYGGTILPPPIIPFFPERARPWANQPWEIPYGPIKAVRQRKRRVKR